MPKQPLKRRLAPSEHQELCPGQGLCVCLWHSRVRPHIPHCKWRIPRSQWLAVHGEAATQRAASLFASATAVPGPRLPQCHHPGTAPVSGTEGAAAAGTREFRVKLGLVHCDPVVREGSEPGAALQSPLDAALSALEQDPGLGIETR